MTQRRLDGIRPILLFLLAILIGCCIFGCGWAVLNAAAEGDGSDALSEAVTQQALDIIAAAGEDGLSEEAQGELAALGLTADQIEMLQSLAQAEADTDTDSGGWQEKELHWYEHPFVHLAAAGILIVAVCIALVIIARRLFVQFRNRR